MTRRTAGNPRVHWALLAISMTAVAVLLLIAGYTGGTLGESTQPPDKPGTVPQAVLDGGPVLDATHPDRPGISLPTRTVALTFDDGPTAWTPRILDVLERHHVPATFFVIGANVTKHESVLRRIVADGGEVGVHTFTHPELGAVPAWRERLELDQTQLAIAAATGHTTNLLRLPYSSVPDAVTSTELRAVRRAGSYRVVFADLDTRDWTRPGAASIAAAGMPADGAGAIVMMHDGGGNRAQTVAALDVLIPRLQAQGYRFTTVSAGIGASSPSPRASAWDRVRGTVLSGAVQTSRVFAGLLGLLFLLVSALSLLRVATLMALARRHTRKPQWAPWNELPAVSVLVPAYNEAIGIAAAVASLAGSDYPVFEVIVIDDGSTDGTAEIVAALSLPGVRVLRQANAGKPVALNTGTAAARYDLLVMVDGDTVFEPDTLRELVAPFTDPRIGAVSGNTKVGNRRGLLGRWQHIEYVIGFNLDRRMFDVLECMPTVPGAIGAFRRSALADVGGVSTATLAEDTDVTMGIIRAGWRVVYAPRARAWTEAPASLSQLWSQRYRWCYGTLQAMWKHRRAVAEDGSGGRLGRRGLAYLGLFQVLLPLLAPVIDVAAVYGVLFLDPRVIALTWLAFLGVQYVGAIYAFRLDGESLRPLWALALQQFVYRQLTYLVVVQSVAAACYGLRLRWHSLRRTGDLDAIPDELVPTS